MQEKVKKRWDLVRRQLLVVGFCLMIVVCYLASVGPASWLCVKGYVPLKAVEIMYSPIWYLKRKSQTASEVVDSYLSIWISFPQPNFEDIPPIQTQTGTATAAETKVSGTVNKNGQ
jgi:hypothetical protein